MKKYGRSSTSAKFDGWSLRETAKLLNEDNSLTSKDIQLAKALNKGVAKIG